VRCEGRRDKETAITDTCELVGHEMLNAMRCKFYMRILYANKLPSCQILYMARKPRLAVSRGFLLLYYLFDKLELIKLFFAILKSRIKLFFNISIGTMDNKNTGAITPIIFFVSRNSVDSIN